MRRIRNPVYGFFRTVGSNPTPSARTQGPARAPSFWRMRICTSALGFDERRVAARRTPAPAVGPGAEAEGRGGAAAEQSHPFRQNAGARKGPFAFWPAARSREVLLRRGINRRRVSALCKGRCLPSAHESEQPDNARATGERTARPWRTSNRFCMRTGSFRRARNSSSRPTCQGWTPTRRCVPKPSATTPASGDGWRAQSSPGRSRSRACSTSRMHRSTSGSTTAS